MSLFLILSILISSFCSAQSRSAFVNQAQTLQPFQFMSEADDIEKEAWWLITGKRLSNDHSPWRLVYKAFLESKGLKSKQVISKMCQKLKVVESVSTSTFTVTTHCQAKPLEMAIVKKLQAQKWEFQFRVPQFVEHFGIGTSIFYQTLVCELDLDDKNKVQKIKCPVYARNRNVEEIVELKNFEFNKRGEPLMQIQGVIKKQFQDVARIETLIPSKGEIFIKEIKIPNPLDAVKVEEFKLPRMPLIHKVEPKAVKPENVEEMDPQDPGLQDPGLQEAPHIDPESEAPAIQEAPPITPSR